MANTQNGVDPIPDICSVLLAATPIPRGVLHLAAVSFKLMSTALKHGLGMRSCKSASTLRLSAPKSLLAKVSVGHVVLEPSL